MAAKLSVTNTLLIIANSARMLAESAQYAGTGYRRLLVIDCFGDADTEAAAHELVVVDDLSLGSLQVAIAFLTRRYAIEQVLVGSGFESQIESLAWLESRFLLGGNCSVTLRAVADPVGFFQSLAHLRIIYPDTRFHPPESDSGLWLVKPSASEGGLNIRFYQGQAVDQNSYWQRYQQGPVFSVLFVANGVDAQWLAYNQQWSTPHQNGQDFVFSGVMHSSDERLQQHHESIFAWLSKLTANYRLVGLNGIDFIIADGQCWFLELNARPPASMVLYPHLFEVHRQACSGILPPAYEYKKIVEYKKTPIRAYQIIYAQARLSIPNNFKWPQWTSDQSPAGTNIDTQQAICSIIAVANNAESVLEQLQHRTQTLYQLLNNKGAFSTCNIQPALINYPNL